VPMAGSVRTIANGRWRLVERLGVGGMAEVWRAWDERLQVWRALKLLRADVTSDAGIRKRFDVEARALAKLRHPHIVAILDVGDDDGQPWLVMELVPGGSLADRVARSGPIAPPTAARLVCEVLSGLQHAHEHGVVHRDVKPHNVLLTAAGKALVSDFGIARVAEGGSELTRTGAAMGTLAYMAPEQRSSAARVDARADVYAAGATLYHVLTGREPLDLYVERAGWTDGLPEALVGVVRKATRYDPSDRFATAGDMARALEDARTGLGDEPPLDVPSTPVPAPTAGPSSETWSGTAIEPSPAPVAPPPAPRAARPIRWWPPAALAAGAGIAAVAWSLGRAPEGPWEALPIDAPGPCLPSPDGEWLACAGEDGAWSVGPTGGEPAWTAPAGASVAFSEGHRAWYVDVADPDAVRIEAPEGGEERTFATPGRVSPDLSLSPDGRSIAYLETRGVVVSSEGAAPRPLGTAAAYLPRWSPDGARLAYAEAIVGEPLRIVVSDVGSGSRAVVLSDERMVQGSLTPVDWSDEHHVVYARIGESGAELWEAAADGEGAPVLRAALPGRAPYAVLSGGGAIWTVQKDAQRVVEVADANTGEVRARWEGKVGAGGPMDVEWLGPTHLAANRASAHVRWQVGSDVVTPWGPEDAVLLGVVGDTSLFVDGKNTLLSGPHEGPWKPIGELPDDPNLLATCGLHGCALLWREGGKRRVASLDPATGELARHDVEVLDERVFFVARGPEGRLAFASSAGLRIVGADGLSYVPGLLGLDRLDSAAWDPGGGLMLAGMRGGRSVVGRFAPPDGLDVLLETSDDITYPTVSPDGASVAWVRDDARGYRVTRWVRPGQRE
jgi:tRNA A-37 threonylcarbamoyl transferase component Bud32